MFISVALLFTTIIFVFVYHYERNGNPLPVGDTLQRLAWAFSFAAGYLMFTIPHQSIFLFGWYVIGSFIAIVAIPHAFAQNMGNRSQTWAQMPPIPLFLGLTVPKWWPGFPVAYISAPTEVQLFFRQDFFGMMCTGFLRGVIVFIPTLWFGGNFIGSIAATAITTVWQPFAYWLGFKIPFILWDNAANSSEWGEFLVPVGWALALLVSVIV
jgi:hypothetical protein